jgi:hypothetical protein
MEHLRLIKKEYHKKESEKNGLEEWWILIFQKNQDKVQMRIDKNDYQPSAWIEGAKYAFEPIEPDSIDLSSLPQDDHRVQRKLFGELNESEVDINGKAKSK